jgi:cytochrome c553
MANPWTRAAVGGVLAILVAAVLIGFLWVPYAQGGKSVSGLWDAICRAAGAPGPRQITAPQEAKAVSSDVIMVPQMIATDSVSVGRGATLALRCTMCHGARGMSEAGTPNLAGQNAEAIYKQLRDLQSGHRESAIMGPHARSLSDQDMRDLAAYYAYLPRLTPPPSLLEQMRSPRIIQVGAPMRNIAPCASCHGGSDRKTASPTLEGEPENYIRAQLQAFRNGTRRNDINEQMRNVARQMTPEEIETVAKYYSQR